MGADQRQRAAERARVDARALRVLRPSSYKLLGALRHFTDPDGYCWPKVKSLMKNARVRDPHTIFRGLRELRRKKFVWRAKMVWLKNQARAVSLYRLGGPIEELPLRAQKRGLTLVGRKHTTPSVNSSHYPPGRIKRTTLVGKTPIENSSKKNLPIKKESPLPSDEATLTAMLDEEHVTGVLLKKLSGQQPSISRDAVRQGVRLATLLASSPPRTEKYYLRAVPDVVSHFPVKLRAWLTQEATGLLEKCDCSYAGGQAELQEELKLRAAAEGLPYDSEVIGSAIDRAERELRAQADLKVGRLR